MENRRGIRLQDVTENIFLIDWLTVVFHDTSVDDVKRMLGLLSSDITWQDRVAFTNGYPVTTFWNNISIRWGADRAEYYKDDAGKSADQKVRSDMGVCLDISGTGCRAFEQYGAGDWLKLFQSIWDLNVKWNITRIDLAYDDHIGILDIHEIEHDTRVRNYVSKARTSYIHWSDNRDRDIQGTTVEIGSRESAVLVRIYDKAAERGFDHTKHWVRVELQLRKSSAMGALVRVLERQHIGQTVSGILRNYLTFRTPTADTNPSRWPIAGYWTNLIQDMERLSVWLTPGEPYNFSKTQHHLIEQYGQVIVAIYRMQRNITDFLDECIKRFPKLNKKYETVINDFKLMEADLKRQRDAERRFYGFDHLISEGPSVFDLQLGKRFEQLDIFDQALSSDLSAAP